MSTGIDEPTIQSALQGYLQAISNFKSTSVVINDWSLLDGSSANAPFLIITTADDFRSRQDSPAAANWWEIPVTIVERFTSWPATLNAMRDDRKAILVAANQGGFRNVGGLSVSLDEIHNKGGILPYYDKYLSAEELRQAVPQFLLQEIGFTYQGF